MSKHTAPTPPQPRRISESIFLFYTPGFQKRGKRQLGLGQLLSRRVPGAHPHRCNTQLDKDAPPLHHSYAAMRGTAPRLPGRHPHHQSSVVTPPRHAGIRFRAANSTHAHRSPGSLGFPSSLQHPGQLPGASAGRGPRVSAAVAGLVGDLPGRPATLLPSPPLGSPTPHPGERQTLAPLLPREHRDTRRRAHHTHTHALTHRPLPAFIIIILLSILLLLRRKPRQPPQRAGEAG